MRSRTLRLANFQLTLWSLAVGGLGILSPLPIQAQSLETATPITQLSGEVIIAPAGLQGKLPDGSTENSLAKQLSLGYRLRLNLDTSFNGSDRLAIQLQSRDVVRFDRLTDSDMTRLGFDGQDPQLELNTLQYRFPINPQTMVYLNLKASAEDFVDDLNPDLGSSGKGAISRFAQRNPIYRQLGSTGLGLHHQFNNNVGLGLGYLAENAASPNSGLFQGPYGIVAQLELAPNDRSQVALTYIHGYNRLDTGTGSQLANAPFGRSSESIRSHAVGLEFQHQLQKQVQLGGWVGYVHATAEDLPHQPQAEVFNYALMLSFPDLGGADHLAGLILGQPPRLISNTWKDGSVDSDTTFHVEGFYRLKLSENLYVTPGIVILLNPEYQAKNPPLYLGSIRITIRF